MAVRLCYSWVKLLFPSKLYIPLCISTLSLTFLRYCLSSLEDIFTREWNKPHEHAAGISQLLRRCVENHMTGRLDLSLSTLDTHVVYFHSFEIATHDHFYFRERGTLGIFLKISKLNSTPCKTRLRGLICILICILVRPSPWWHQWQNTLTAICARFMQGLSWNRTPLRHITIDLETQHVIAVPWRIVSTKMTFISVKITIQTLIPVRLGHVHFTDVVIEQS